jgi:hypothetical protein
MFRNSISAESCANYPSWDCPIFNNIGDLFIGKGFTGVIDDVILYNRELTVAEVKQLQNLPVCCE